MTRGDRMTPDPRTYKKLFDELKKKHKPSTLPIPFISIPKNSKS